MRDLILIQAFSCLETIIRNPPLIQELSSLEIGIRDRLPIQEAEPKKVIIENMKITNTEVK